MSKMMVFTGNANRDLAQKVVDNLRLPLGNAKVDKFSDGEVAIEINENVEETTINCFAIFVNMHYIVGEISCRK